MTDQIEPLGGPLVCMPRHSVSSWGGNLNTERSGGNDYLRACNVKQYIGVIDGGVIVLSGVPMVSSVVRCGDGFYMIVRKLYAEPWYNPRYDSSINLIEAYPIVDKMQLKVNSTEEFVLFDAVLAGHELKDDFITFPLPEGGYEIITYDYNPDSETSCIVHKFKSMGIKRGVVRN